MKLISKLVLSIVLAVTAIMLVLAFVFVINISKGISNVIEGVEAAVTIFVLTIIGFLAGIPWLITALAHLIFIPIILTARTLKKMERRVRGLLITTCVLGVPVIITMALCWTFAFYSIPLVAVLVIADLCFIADLVVTSISYRKLRRARNKATQVDIEQ